MCQSNDYKKSLLIVLALAIVFLASPLGGPSFASAQTTQTISVSELRARIEILKQRIVVLKNSPLYRLSPVSTLPLSVLTSVLPAKYHPILNDSKINAAVIKIGSFDYISNSSFDISTSTLQTEELNFLRDKIIQLENKNTQDWEQYRAFLQNGTFPPAPVYRELWLQQIALSFYVEANGIVPWSLIRYNESELSMLLSFNDSSYTDSIYFFNNNPLIPYAYGVETSQLYPPTFSSSQNLLSSVIKKMRNDLWLHFSGSVDYLAACKLSRLPLDFQCLKQVKRGGSEYIPLFIASILKAYNVPSQRVGAPRYQGHGGITFPSLSLAMDGDQIFEQFASGFSSQLITPPKTNLIPVEISFMDLDFAKSNIILPANPDVTLQCNAASAGVRFLLLSYFGLFNHPTAREDLVFAYNYNFMGNYEPGQFLREAATVHSRPFFCTSNDPSNVAYWKQPLSDDELDYWISNIAFPAPSASITSPNGGELILRGSRSPYRITWQELNVDNPSQYKINLILKSDRGDRNLFTDLIGGVGYKDWFVPKDLPLGRYKLQVCASRDSNPCAYSDQSDNYFSIIDIATAEPITPITLSPVEPILIPPPSTTTSAIISPVVITSPPPTLTSSTPPHNAVDARDGSGLGFKFAVLTFSSDLGSDWNNLNNYSVATTQATASGLAVSSVSGSPYRPIVVLSRNIVPGERITITHKPGGGSICLGFLPGNVDQDGWALSRDIGLLNSWLGTAEGAAQPLWKTDINRDGVFTVQDVTRAGELMADPNRVYRIPACPAPLTSISSQSQLANALSALRSALGELSKVMSR